MTEHQAELLLVLILAWAIASSGTLYGIYQLLRRIAAALERRDEARHWPARP